MVDIQKQAMMVHILYLLLLLPAHIISFLIHATSDGL